MRALIPTDAVEGAKMWKADPDSVCSEVLAFAGTSVLIDETGEYASTAFLLVGVIGGGTTPVAVQVERQIPQGTQAA